MSFRSLLCPLLAAFVFLPLVGSPPAPACCPAPPSGKPVVNADQTVIIIWDAAAKMQHFIRQASFKGDADDFGFLIPSPSEPELSESGNDAFPILLKLTEPEVITQKRPSNGGGCGCGAVMAPGARGLDLANEPAVKVLQEKMVAGFHAKVLEAKTTQGLVEWLKENGYAYSPEVAAWAKPYVEQGWMITALKVAKDNDATKDKQAKTVSAAALRMSFKTDRPLFPYREPDSTSAAKSLSASSRLLRIYFIAEARYRGDLTKDVAWTGKVAWSGKLADESRKKILDQLKLSDKTGPAEWWLTEFEDNWPYRVAPADLYFAIDETQNEARREPIIRFVASPWPSDITVYALAAVLIVPPIVRRWRRK